MRAQSSTHGFPTPSIPRSAEETRSGGARRFESEAAPGVEVWFVDLKVPPAPESLGALSAEELARAARFVFDADRRRYLNSHCALRELLASAVSLPVDAVELRLGSHGKPYLPDSYAIPFNMSHSGELALIGLGVGLARDAELGIDVEEMRPVSDSLALAAMNFTAEEQAELRVVAPEQRDRAFLRGWTRKEACLKAVGSGLSIAPATFHCGLAAAPGVARVAAPTGTSIVEFVPLDIGEEHVASLAIIHPT